MFPQSIYISNRTYKESLVGRFARIKKDWERTSDGLPRTGGLYWKTTTPSYDYRNMKDYGAHMGMPDQFNRFDNEFIELENNQQWLWMNVCCQATWKKNYDELSKIEREYAKSQWKSLTWTGRCFNNGSGREDGYDDFVLPFRGNKNIGMNQESVVCSSPDGYPNNLVKIVGEPVKFTSIYLATKPPKSLWHYPIEVINVKKPLPKASELVNMNWLCHSPSISTGKKLSVGYQIQEFSQFYGKSKYILWGNGTNIGYIRADWVELL